MSKFSPPVPCDLPSNFLARIVCLIFLMETAIASGPLSAPAVATDVAVLHGNVIAITDGDTVQILVDRQPVKVRLWGIDAPEHNQPFGARSQQSLSAAVFGKEVEVEDLGHDRYGRTLGIIRVGKVNANLLQVQQGMAWWYRKYAPAAAEFAAAEAEARKAGRGLWADAAAQPPWEFRRDRRGPKN